MKLGTHNSMSYLPPKHWWMKPFHFIARCQSLHIDKQYRAGARMFDIRVSYNKHGEAEFRHGAMAFEGDVEGTFKYLSSLGKPLYIRLVLEVKKTTKNREDKERLFINDCKRWSETYKHLKFFCGRRKYDWVQLYKFKLDDIDVIQKISSMTGTVLDDWWPWLYARTHNAKNYKDWDAKKWAIFDFIEYLF